MVVTEPREGINYYVILTFNMYVFDHLIISPDLVGLTESVVKHQQSGLTQLAAIHCEFDIND